MILLTNEEIQKDISKLSVEWAMIDGVHLERVFDFENFADGLNFVNKIGKIAEKQNHHPEINLSYDKVIVRTSTHSEGGLTKKDFDLAKLIEELK